MATARLPGYDGIRFALPADRERLNADVSAAIHRAEGEANLLALSGGGARGAFGAGVLCGWTARGDRPAFQVVCGVSTGALIAPFAFAGPGADEPLKAAFIELERRDVYHFRNPFTLFRADSLSSTAPLERELARLIDDRMLAAIAEGHRDGRRLYVLTTDFDAERLVVWDLGAIAASGNPDAAALFRRVLLAAAAIPVAFQPQYFTVEAGGQTFDEMHFDGGLMQQVFLPLPGEGTPRPRLHVIMNGNLKGGWLADSTRLAPIGNRAFHVLVRAQTLAALQRIRGAAEAAGYPLAVASIPASFEGQPRPSMGTPRFDPAYMRQLFELGFSLAAANTAFAPAPPPDAHDGW